MKHVLLCVALLNGVQHIFCMDKKDEIKVEGLDELKEIALEENKNDKQVYKQSPFHIIMEAATRSNQHKEKKIGAAVDLTSENKCLSCVLSCGLISCCIITCNCCCGKQCDGAHVVCVDCPKCCYCP